MSTSIQVVQVAAVSSDCFIRWPIVRRIRDRPSLEPVTTGVREREGSSGSGRYGLSMCIGGSAAAPLPLTSASTSCLRTRPLRPVPVTDARSMSCSAAIRWTTGE